MAACSRYVECQSSSRGGREQQRESEDVHVELTITFPSSPPLVQTIATTPCPVGSETLRISLDLSTARTERSVPFLFLNERGRDRVLTFALVSQLQPGSYTSMPSYRVLTTDGPTQLSAGMHKKLLEVLRRVHEEEGRERDASG